MAGQYLRHIQYARIMVLLLSSIIALQTRGDTDIDQTLRPSVKPNVTNGPLSPARDSRPNMLSMLEGKLLETKPSKTRTTSQSKQDYLLGNFVQVVKEKLVQLPPRKLLPYPKDMDQTCYDELMMSFEALVGEPRNTSQGNVTYTSMDWAIRVFDAFGKPGPGIMAGALQFTGYYDQCVQTYGDVPAGTTLLKNVVKENKYFPMRYCRVQYNLENKIPQLKAVPKHVATEWWNNGTLPPPLINWGVCVPHSCSGHDIKTILSMDRLDLIGVPVEDVVCFDEPSLKEDTPALITVVVFCSFVVLVLVCTAIDVWLCHFPMEARKKDTQVERSKNKATMNGVKDYIAFRTKTEMQTLSRSKESEKASNGRNINLITSCNGHAKTQKSLNNTGEVDKHRNSKDEEGQQCVVPVETDSAATKIPRNHSKNTQHTARAFVEAFSFYTNFGKLLLVKSSPDTIKCLAGIRFISIVWIILGHTFTYGAILDERNQMFDNPDQLPKLIASTAFHIIGSAQLAVDTFFVQSGFLAMKKISSERRFKENSSKPLFWVKIIFQRFWRLTPVYVMVMLAGTFLYDHMVHGPLKADKFEEFYECRTKWWAHLLYINNFYEPAKKCMTWTWYLAVDMQLFVLLPIFVIPTSRNKRVGAIVIVGGIFLSMVAAFVCKYDNPGAFIMMDTSFIDYWKHVYTTPLARAGAFLVGQLLGIFLSTGDGKPIMSKTKAFLVWIVAAALALFLIFIMHDQWRAHSDHWPPATQALYEAFVRPAWAMCIAWVIYACCTGLGGFANTVLSWDAFIPLSRLGYCMYLLHPLVITFVLYSRRTTIYMDPTHLSIIYNFFGNLALTILLSVVFSMIFEAPMMTLEKMFLRKSGGERRGERRGEKKSEIGEGTEETSN